MCVFLEKMVQKSLWQVMRLMFWDCFSMSHLLSSLKAGESSSDVKKKHSFWLSSGNLFKVIKDAELTYFGSVSAQ